MLLVFHYSIIGPPVVEAYSDIFLMLMCFVSGHNIDEFDLAGGGVIFHFWELTTDYDIAPVGNSSSHFRILFYELSPGM
jgi:hypothetical protein